MRIVTELSLNTPGVANHHIYGKSLVGDFGMQLESQIQILIRSVEITTMTFLSTHHPHIHLYYHHHHKTHHSIFQINPHLKY